jgi:Fe-S cluster assembly protein SufD
MSETSEIRNWYLSLFKDFENRLNGEKSQPVHRIRRAAIDKFAELDFPNLHQEDWRFTDISPILKQTFSYATGKESPAPSAKGVSRFLFGGMRAYTMVFVNGFYSAALSKPLPLPAGVVIASLAEAMKSDDGQISGHISRYLDPGTDAFTALNTAFTLDGAYINVPDGIVVEDPVHILFLSTGDAQTISQPRNLVITGRNSQIRIIERYAGMRSGVYFTNSVTEVKVGKNSLVDAVKVQGENVDSYHVATTVASVGADGNYESHALSNGSKIYRHNVNVTLEGEGGNTTLEGLYLTAGDQLSDTHSMIDHASPHCTSGEHYKGILDGKSRAVFNGKIMVRKDAQKTNSYQENRNIILSNEARVDTKPQLEIFADDVKCSHGATVGQLSKESMFYLRSRGIGEEQARMILIYAFASDVLKNIREDAVRSELENVLATRFLIGVQ